jgi:hypothetical protein
VTDLTYQGKFAIGQLHDELEAAKIAELAPLVDAAGDRVAVYTVVAGANVSADGTYQSVIVTVASQPTKDAAAALKTKVDAVVAAHVAKPPPTEAQMALLDIRMRRDRYLAQTDWVTLPAASLPTDLPLAVTSDITANLAAWKTYRQQLRDYPGQPGFDPLNPPPWPMPPPAPAMILT